MVYLLGCIALTVGAALLLWRALRADARIDIRLIVGAVCLLGLSCILVGSISFLGLAASVIADSVSTWTAFAAFITGACLVFTLKGKRRLAAIFIGLIYPAALFLSSALGYQRSPEAALQHYGGIIVEKIDQFHADRGYYPGRLDDLVPAYLDDLRPPPNAWGWLYTGGQTQFSLGYLYGTDVIGYSMCGFSSSRRTWRCRTNSAGLFGMTPTPEFWLYH